MAWVKYSKYCIRNGDRLICKVKQIDKSHKYVSYKPYGKGWKWYAEDDTQEEAKKRCERDLK